MANAIQDFYYHPHTSTNTARDLKFNANRVSPANETLKINLWATDSICNFPGGSRLGPLIKQKASMQGKHPDTAMGGGISRNYSFMNEISITNIQGMIHGRLIKYSGVMMFIHIIDHKFSYMLIAIAPKISYNLLK